MRGDEQVTTRLDAMLRKRLRLALGNRRHHQRQRRNEGQKRVTNHLGHVLDLAERLPCSSISKCRAKSKKVVKTSG